MKRSGFTLVELVVTLIVVTILVATFAPRLASESINLGAQAEQLSGDIRYVQSLAMTRGQRFRINFTATNYFFTLADVGGTPEPHPATNSTAPIQLQSGITITLPPTNLPNNLAAFDGKGRPYTDNIATMLLAAGDAVITLSVASDSRTVRISPQTGRVIVQ